ncbi:serine/threonine protein kinase, partial [Microbacterium halimionae]
MSQRLPSAPPVIPGLVYVRPLGSGGFADVFLYAQDMPRRQVAVKVLPSDVRDPGLLRMFNSEADVLAHLSAHPSIVTVYQAGVSADGRPYIVMEYCPGSFAQRYRVERLPVADVLATGVRMASALESAHRAGLIHRDVKPS